jgi:hypothetical protein
LKYLETIKKSVWLAIDFMTEKTRNKFRKWGKDQKMSRNTSIDNSLKNKLKMPMTIWKTAQSLIGQRNIN